MRRYNELCIDAINVIALLETSPAISSDLSYTGRLVLGLFVNSCTPAAVVDEFEQELDNIVRMIREELGE